MGLNRWIHASARPGDTATRAGRCRDKPFRKDKRPVCAITETDHCKKFIATGDAFAKILN